MQLQEYRTGVQQHCYCRRRHCSKLGRDPAGSQHSHAAPALTLHDTTDTVCQPNPKHMPAFASRGIKPANGRHGPQLPPWKPVAASPSPSWATRCSSLKRSSDLCGMTARVVFAIVPNAAVPKLTRGKCVAVVFARVPSHLAAMHGHGQAWSPCWQPVAPATHEGSDGEAMSDPNCVSTLNLVRG